MKKGGEAYMKNLKQTIFAVATGAMVFTTVLVSSTSAASANCENRNTGPRSRNVCHATVRQETRNITRNWARVNNNVGVFSNTGGNEIRNVNGDVDMTTGDVTVDILIDNNVNHNE